jgi:ribose/xylose/arabinose/galactoside ABC-type transport system permease subunit
MYSIAMIKRNIIITILATTITVILCTIGIDTASKPLDSMGVIWPGAVLHSAGGALFGAWGIIATILSGTITNYVNVGSPAIILGFIFPNFIQSLIPAFYYRKRIRCCANSSEIFNFKPFLIYGILLPNIIGGLSGTIILQSMFKSDLPFWFPFTRWLIANIPISIILGYPLFRFLGPTLMEEGYIVKGWWK